MKRLVSGMRGLCFVIAVAVTGLFAGGFGCSSAAPLFECRECVCQVGMWEKRSPETVPDVILAGNPLVQTPDGLVLVGRFFTTVRRMSLWRWDGTNWTDMTIADASAAPNKAGLASAYHAGAGHLVVVGGQGVGLGPGGPIQTWALADNVWTLQDNAPTDRTNAHAAYDAAEGLVIVAGGHTSGFVPSPTWTWDGSAWGLLVSGPEPPPRVQHALAYDEVRETVVMFGGVDPNDVNTIRGDTWLYTAGEWALASPDLSPTARTASTLTYYPDHEVSVLIGGSVGPLRTDEVWTWDGTTWERIRVPGQAPTQQGIPVAAYDAANQGVLVFDGETWLFRLASADAASGACCGDGVCQFPERDPRHPVQACPADCP